MNEVQVLDGRAIYSVCRLSLSAFLPFLAAHNHRGPSKNPVVPYMDLFRSENAESDQKLFPSMSVGTARQCHQSAGHSRRFLAGFIQSGPVAVLLPVISLLLVFSRRVFSLVFSFFWCFPSFSGSTMRFPSVSLKILKRTKSPVKLYLLSSVFHHSLPTQMSFSCVGAETMNDAVIVQDIFVFVLRCW